MIDVKTEYWIYVKHWVEYLALEKAFWLTVTTTL